MPFSGGWSPSPMRTGGGDAGSAAPRLQRIFESIAARRGKAFDQTDESIVGAENMALARAIDADVYGANERFANEMNPATSTIEGLLPRWEIIFGVPPQPGDTQQSRQARVASAAGKFGSSNSTQGVVDACTAILGPLFVGLTLITPTEANTWWPGLTGNVARITAVAGNLVTITDLVGPLPTDAAGKNIILSRALNALNDGTFFINSRVDAHTVIFVNPAGVAPDNGIGGSPDFGEIVWSMPNPVSPWTSTIAHVTVQVNPNGAPGYVNADGTVNGAFYAKVNELNPVLDWLLDADQTFDWYILSSHGGTGWYLDEPNLDLEAFDS